MLQQTSIMSVSSRFHLMLNLLLLRYCFRKTLFQHLNPMVHIFFGLKSQFFSHDNENVSPWQRKDLIKTLQQLFSHVSHYCPVPPQLARVSEMALLGMIARFWWGFFFSLPLEHWSNTTENWGKCGCRNLCCVMSIPGFSFFFMQKKPQNTLTYLLKNVSVYL